MPEAAPSSPMPTPGDRAPAIVAETTNVGAFDLAAHRGRWVAIYFYPRANTPG